MRSGYITLVRVYECRCYADDAKTSEPSCLLWMEDSGVLCIYVLVLEHRGPPQTQQLSLCCTLHAHDGARKNIDPKLSDCDACKISSIWWGRRRTLRHHESRWCLTGDPPIDVEVSWHIVMVSLKSALTGTRICRWHLADVLGGVLGQWRSFL